MGEYPVEVFLCDDGYWKNDTVFIWNQTKCISKKEILNIIQFLYDEGFIKDRRTKYFVSEKEYGDENDIKKG